MELVAEPLKGVFRFRLKRLEDSRGSFLKTYRESVLAAAGASFDLRETYYSVSNKEVLRGMHFQTPPFALDKIICCLTGAVMDVLLDLRSGPGYGKFASMVLSGSEPETVFIPRGVAHGFLSLQDNSLMAYYTSTEYDARHDTGVLWDSFGFNWGIANPLVSDRDRLHPTLSEFGTPF